MPLLPDPDYTPKIPFTSGHIQTIYPTLFRRKPAASPVRQRIETEDGDFLDLDYHFPDDNTLSNRLAIVSHGLEGDSRKKNVLGMAQALVSAGWDVICYNFRGCSGEMNRLPRLYHSGVTNDLHTVLCHGLGSGNYHHAALVGFSMGGNQTLKYLGEAPGRVPAEVQAACVFSVPVELADSAAFMGRRANRIYMEYFLASLRRKIRLKAEVFPEIFDTRGLAKIKTFAEFDDKYTGPIHGFIGADDYYEQCSAKQFMHAIKVPTLLVQAKDDPFLPQSCYPVREAMHNENLYLEMPRYGGHVGFVTTGRKNRYWLEDRAVAFLSHFLN